METTADGPLPMVGLCVPGPWDHERDLERLQGLAERHAPGVKLAGGPQDPGVTERLAAGNQAGPEHALGDADLAAIERHTAAIYLLSPRFERSAAAPVAHGMLKAACALVAQGGSGLLCESSGKSLSPAGAKRCLAAADAAFARLQALRKAGGGTPEQGHEAKLAFWGALVDAYVGVYGEDDDADVYHSTGLHLLGQPDGEVVRGGVDEDPARGAGVLRLLALYLAAESGGRVRAGQTFHDAEGGTWSLSHVRRPARFDEQAFERNPWGYVRLASAAGAPIGSPVEADLPPDAARRVHRALAFLAGADGKIGATEQAVLQAYRARLGIPDAEAAALEREGAQGKGIVLGKGAAERDLLQQGLLEVITADGEVQDGEARRLKRVVASLGLAPRDIIPPLRALLG